MRQPRPAALVILDGWGHADNNPRNAIAQASPATFNFLWDHYPHTLLKASGRAVGLPEGVPGNSEVGHETIGAGAILQQPLTIINAAIHDGSFFKNPSLVRTLDRCKTHNGRLHLLGLLSDGNIHSNEQHLFALLRAAAAHQIPHVFVHAFLDGRDSPPRSAEKFLHNLEAQLQQYGGSLASITGRFYAMDRDENWEQTLATFTMLTGTNIDISPWRELIDSAYTNGINDEFIPPACINADGHIKDDDTLIFFNIRPDRIRQLVALLLRAELPSKKNVPLPAVTDIPKNLYISSLVNYHTLFKNAYFFEKQVPNVTLLDELEERGYSLFTIAETEKYAHITYFFNGGREDRRTRETRVLVPSRKERSYALAPAMSAEQITRSVVDALHKCPADFYLINYANADMVGHSGNLASTISAIRCIDQQLALLYAEFVTERNGILFITADHGKAEELWDRENEAQKTAHTCNPVPFIMIEQRLFDAQRPLELQGLSDITPFILKQLPELTIQR